MEKVSNIAKNLFAGFLDLLFHPVSKVTETVQKEDIKKGAIKGVILAFALALINVLAEIRALRIINTKDRYFSNAVDAFRPVATLFKTFALNIVGIIVVALILFIIFKLVKDQKSITYTLSMVVNSAIVYTVVLLVSLIFGLIPGVFGTGVASLLIAIGKTHACLTLIVSFMSSLTNVNTDQLILVAIVVFAIVGIISTIIHLITTKEELGDFTRRKYIYSPEYYSVEPAKIDTSSVQDMINDTVSSSIMNNLF